MRLVRSLRARPDYRPNTRHAVFGQDADLLLLRWGAGGERAESGAAVFLARAKSDGIAPGKGPWLQFPPSLLLLLASLLLHEPHFTVVRELFESKVGTGHSPACPSISHYLARHPHHRLTPQVGPPPLTCLQPSSH